MMIMKGFIHYVNNLMIKNKKEHQFLTTIPFESSVTLPYYDLSCGKD